MVVALICAFGATLSYGLSTVLQSIGAQRAAGSDTLDLRLMMRLAQQGPYVIGLGLDGVGVVCTILALRRLPLFVVQAAIAASLAVTAIGATRAFDTTLTRREWGAIAAVGIGLVLVAASAGPEGPPPTSTVARLVLLGLLAVIAVLSLPAGRISTNRGAAALGALAGAAFGIGNTALRIIPSFDPGRLVANPATLVAVSGALLGVFLFATSLQRGAVTVATGTSVVTQSLLPALYGTIVLGERPRPGWALPAIVGFAVTVAAALALARFGEVTT